MVPPNHPFSWDFAIFNHPFWGPIFLERPTCCLGWFLRHLLQTPKKRKAVQPFANSGFPPKAFAKKAWSSRNLHPRKLTWNLKMNPWKRRFLWKTIIFRFHVSFRGCNIDTKKDGFQNFISFQTWLFWLSSRWFSGVYPVCGVTVFFFHGAQKIYSSPNHKIPLGEKKKNVIFLY